MKTKKKLLIALLSATCLTAGAFGIAACSDEHTHSWKYDDTQHWQECETDSTHNTAKEDHDMSDTDGVCSVCGYTAAKKLTGETTTVNATKDGVVYAFTPKTAGAYTLSWTQGNALISVCNAAGVAENTDGVTSPYTFTVDGTKATVYFLMSCKEGNTETYDVTIARAAAVEAVKITSDTTTVHATQDGVVYSVSPKTAGTYKLSWDDDNALIMACEADGYAENVEGETSPYTFTVDDTKSTVYFLMCCKEGETADYDVTVEAVDDEPDLTWLELGEATTVTTTQDGVVYAFSTVGAGTYELNCTGDAASIAVEDATGSGSDNITVFPYTFTLDVMGMIKFTMYPADYDTPSATYTVTVTAKPVEPTYEKLTGDTNTVNANFDGVLYAFSPKTGGNYKLTWTDPNALIMACDAAGVAVNLDGETSPYTFTIDGTKSTVYFLMCSKNGEPAEYEVTISDVEDESDTIWLELGEATTVTTTQDGVSYAFSAVGGGTFELNCTGDAASIAVEDANGSGSDNITVFPHTFTLDVMGMIKFTMYPADFETPSATYTVTITAKTEESTYEKLNLGTTTVNATSEDVLYAFAAKTPGKYELTWNNSNALIIACDAEGYGENLDGETSPYTFTAEDTMEMFYFLIGSKDMTPTTFDVTIAPAAAVDPVKITSDTTTVHATKDGVVYSVSPRAPGAYKLTWNNPNALIMACDAAGIAENVAGETSPYVFTAEDTMVTVYFLMCCKEGETADYDVTVAPADDEATAETLTLGVATTVSAPYSGIVYAFTAAADGKYVLNCTGDHAADAYIMVNDEEKEVPHTFTLDEGDTIYFLMSYDENAYEGDTTLTVSYTVTVSAVADAE